MGTSRAAGIYKIADGADANTVLDLGTTDETEVKETCRFNAWSGVDEAAPFDGDSVFASSTTVSGTTHPSPSIVTTADGAVVVTTASFKDSSVSAITAPTGWTDRGSSTSTGGGRSSTAHASKAAATGGSYGGESWTTDAIPSSRAMFTFALKPQVATQTARPVNDVTATNTTDENLGTVDLYTTIDESILNTADYVRAIEGGVYEALLATMTAPPSESGFQVKYVVGLGDGAASATVDTYLMQGATQIAHWTDEITADNTTVSHTLTGVEFDAITTWSDLRIRWVATDLSG
ncbi:hypothetical protein BJF79_03580 [Actinomadura sp. CNU-125]|uniref:hypothetical protein n=1 Tax=Actinomadura sp. CNU-125 TaxID=1904961 RepID=UPI0009631A0B|nr:hypothetical protein [Actinomadura sp. CNU-125]OLT12993.1 hypothetical protein BJF79_03580 [Actinomadura sp. CNU-125]